MTRRRNRRRRTRKQKGGYKQYLSNIGFTNSYEPTFDRTMNTPSAIRIFKNWA